MLKKHIPNVTIIKLSNKIESAFDVDKIISMENGILYEQGAPQKLVDDPHSHVGKKLKDANLKGYLFMNKISRAQLGKKNKKKVSILIFRWD